MRKSRAATMTPLFARGSFIATSLVRLPLHHPPPWRFTIIAKGTSPPAPKRRPGPLHRPVIVAVAVAPRPPVEIPHHRKGALPLGAEQAREERLVAVGEIL